MILRKSLEKGWKISSPKTSRAGRPRNSARRSRRRASLEVQMLRNLPSASNSKRNSLKVLTRATKGLRGSPRELRGSLCGKARTDLVLGLSEGEPGRESLPREPAAGVACERRFEVFERCRSICVTAKSSDRVGVRGQKRRSVAVQNARSQDGDAQGPSRN